MVVDIDDSDEYDSQPGSHVSSCSASCISHPNSQASCSRQTSDAGMHMKQIHSFGTESTLVGSYDTMSFSKGQVILLCVDL